MSRLPAYIALILLGAHASPGLAALPWGADLSSAPRLQAAGATWSVDGEEGGPLELMASTGWSLLRLRLWHTPAEPWQGLDSTLAMARRGRAAGFDLLLNLHYSDTWADPGHQDIPAAWTQLPLPLLADSVRVYTRRVLERFANEGLEPRWVQLGNEIDGGLLWPTGRVGGVWDTPAQWLALRQLVGAAALGVEEAFPDGNAPARLIHLANSGWMPGCRRFLDSLSAGNVPFESIGLSYYPWWHGAPESLQETMDELTTRFGHELLIVETAYPFTLGWNDNTHNLVGEESQLLPGYPATTAGQQAFLEMLRARLESVPGGLGRGLLYWEPALISAPLVGSPWENLCLFDFNGVALPALSLPGWLDPRPPTLAASLTPARTIRLSWESVPGVGLYRVERAHSLTGPWQTAVVTGALEWESEPATGKALFRVRSVGQQPQ